ncbi:MAG: ATP-binding protein [Gemmatimonadaceae bacterium]|nr:ATP-binding protein [Gemmatimonadaceae bacterium]
MNDMTGGDARRERRARDDAAASSTETIELARHEYDRLRDLERLVDEHAARIDALALALAQERERIGAVFEQAPVFVAVLRGPTHVFERVNAAYYQVVGHRELIGRAVIEAIPEVRDQGFIELLDQVLDSGEPYVGSGLPVQLQRARDGDPESRYVDFVYAPLTEADGSRSGVVAIGSDVTERVQAEMAHAASVAAADLDRRRLDAVLAALPVGVIVVSAPRGSVVYANDALRAIFGVVPETARLDDYSLDWRGWHVHEGRVTDREYASHEWPVARALLHGVTVLDEAIAVLRADRTRIMISVHAAPIRDATGALVGAVAVVADIEAQHRARLHLEEARHAAEQANVAKSTFLANMSHELRTPLNAIAGHVHLIDLGLHGPVTDEQRQALARVQGAQRHLLGLINDVLNFARLQAGRIEFDLAPVDVADVVADVLPMVEPQLASRGLVLDAGVPRDAGHAGARTVLADRDKLGQVLLNLVSNAIKFTPAARADGTPGRITIDLASRPHRPDLVFLRVIDNGIGIPRDKHAAIFDPFVQVRSGYTRTAEGAGLGLAISRDLARGMGGDLRVRSVPEQGATFTIALRRAQPESGVAADRRIRGDRRASVERRTGGERRSRRGE